MKKLLSTLIVFVLLSTTSFYPVYASTQDNVKDIEVTQDELEVALNELSNKKLIEIDNNTKVRDITLDNNIILKEELTIKEEVLRFGSSRSRIQITSKVTIKNNINLTAAVLTTIGYFNYDGSTCSAYDGDVAMGLNSPYRGTGYISKIESTPNRGYVRVTGKFHIEGGIMLDWLNIPLTQLDVVSNVFCDHNGNYFSQWN